MIIPNIWENKKVPNHQPVMIEVPQSTNMWGSSRRTWLGNPCPASPHGAIISMEFQQKKPARQPRKSS